MEDIFKKEICSICKNNINCKYLSIIESNIDSIKLINCKKYLKDESKIVPFKEPEFIEIKGKKLYEI